MKHVRPTRLSIANVFRRRLGLLLALAPCLLCIQSPTRLFAQATESTIHNFTGSSDGFFPDGALVEDKAGNLFGATDEGGLVNAACRGCGTVFEFSPKAGGGWTKTTIYAFTGGADGSNPQDGVTLDSLGNLYGVTGDGGNTACSFGCGAAYELTPKGDGSWTETTLYDFKGGADGAGPSSRLVFDAQGNLYGYTYLPTANNCGTIFELSPSGNGWVYTVIYRVPCAAPGPLGIYSLIIDKNGNLYGTSYAGGIYSGGTIFKLSRQSGSWTESVLFNFGSLGSASGTSPAPDGLVVDPSGNLYGTVTQGGNPSCDYYGGDGCGAVFELSAGGAYTVLYAFTGNGDGAYPKGALAFSNGTLYGTTIGASACPSGGTPTDLSDCGTLFALREDGDGNWHENTIYYFPVNNAGGAPQPAGIAFGANGHLYGLTLTGGSGYIDPGQGDGTAYEIALASPPQTPAAVLPPSFSPSSGVYASTQTVTIADATPGASIYYTTDGTIPTAASKPYTAPIPVASTERITAVAIVPGAPAATASAVYSIAPPSEAVGAVKFGAGFASATGALQFNGATGLDGARLQLTNGGSSEVGSAFTSAPVNIQAFTTYFTFQQAEALADGFTFAIQNQAPAALGGTGGYLGYQGIPQSVALKFDIHNNDGEGTDSTGLYLDGAAPTVPAIDLASTGIDLRSGDPMLAQITYNGTNLALTLTDTATFATWSHSFAVNIPATVGGDTAYVGFTGATGVLAANQEILSWTYVAGPPAALPPALAIPASPAFSSGFNALGVAQNGSATLDGTALQLTDGGYFESASAFYANPLNIQSFTTDFTFQLGSANASVPLSDLEDGIAFAIQNVGSTALGDYGKSLGYAPIGQSVAIKFDTHDDAGEGQDSTGLYVDGALPTVPSINLAGTGIDLHSGDPFAAHLVYNGTTLAMTLTDTVTLATWSHSFTIDIPAAVGAGTAYVGFTGGTGALASTQQVLNWSFANP